MKFNTAIAALMALVNDFYQNGCPRGDLSALLLMLSPLPPHGGGDVGEPGLAKERGMASHPELAHLRREQDLASEVTMAVQVPASSAAPSPFLWDSGRRLRRLPPWLILKAQKFVEGKQIIKTILVPNKLVNLIAK